MDSYWGFCFRQSLFHFYEGLQHCRGYSCVDPVMFTVCVGHLLSEHRNIWSQTVAREGQYEAGQVVPEPFLPGTNRGRVNVVSY